MEMRWASPRKRSPGSSAHSLLRSSGWQIEAGHLSEFPREKLPDTQPTGHTELDSVARRPVQRHGQEWIATALKGDPFGDLSAEHCVRGQANGISIGELSSLLGRRLHRCS